MPLLGSELEGCCCFLCDPTCGVPTCDAQLRSWSQPMVAAIQRVIWHRLISKARQWKRIVDQRPGILGSLLGRPILSSIFIEPWRWRLLASRIFIEPWPIPKIPASMPCPSKNKGLIKAYLGLIFGYGWYRGGILKLHDVKEFTSSYNNSDVFQTMGVW